MEKAEEKVPEKMADLLIQILTNTKEYNLLMIGYSEAKELKSPFKLKGDFTIVSG